MRDLTITLLQSDLYWHNIDANLAMFEEKIWKIDSKSDLIILPEMFNTGFTMASEKYAEPMNSKTFRWMKQQAAQTKAVITGSFIVKEKNQYFNRLLWMKPDGHFAYYDKKHLFRMADEHKYFTAGNKILIQEINNWRICPMICYDLRFPVWSRNSVTKDTTPSYDLLLYVANWPSVRIDAWDQLLKARAIENLSYVAGINRIGENGHGIEHNGHSAVIDYKGETIYFKKEKEDIKTLLLNYEELADFRKKFPAHLDADDFEIIPPSTTGKISG